VTLGCAVINLSLAETVIKERVYVVRGASKLVLGVPAIRSVGLILEIPGTYSVKAVNQMPDNHSDQGQRRTLSSSTRRYFKALANWKVSIQFI